jgi:hypothetical protein
VGDERAETYLRLLAEAETRRAGGGSGPDIARSVEQVRWAGDILVTAGVLEPGHLDRVAGELETALVARLDPARSGRGWSWYARRVNWLFAMLADAPPAEPPRWAPAQPMQVTPVGQRIGVAHDRAPSDLHLMALVRSPDRVTITAAMRMRWPPDGSSAAEEITGAGPQHLPYDRLWAADDRGTRYRVEMSGEGGTLTWHGALGLTGRLPADARWLDLIADGTHRLARIDLDLAEVQPTAATEQAPAVPPGERMLAAAAERLLASAWDSSGPRAPDRAPDRAPARLQARAPARATARAPARLGETITVLAAAGALAPDSPTPGHLAALAQHLGVSEHGITVPPAAQIPARWAEVLPPLDGPGDLAGPGSPDSPASTADPSGPEWFAPLGPAAADVDGARFAFAGLATAGGQSLLHVVATGVAPRAVHRSWWVRDDAGRWHLATETDPDVLAEGTGRTVAFRLRLTPPLGARPDTIEVEVTGRCGRASVVVPVGKADHCSPASEAG